ncbi:MoxR family ATPase [Haloechinothrix sp. YIM 98757]|uniref:MoxR family ATPase n=1 Tax=Haloechinothrix aidingensis TaxID=2752311 RepID=A0A838A9Z1_9PSEU|nr:MoxR family ATPase [Haloechinothrix aidingensis]
MASTTSPSSVAQPHSNGATASNGAHAATATRQERVPTHTPHDAATGARADHHVAGFAELHETVAKIANNIERVLVGKSEVVRIAMVTLLSEGHLLVEDVPGVGKTSLAKALARSIDCPVSRVQFTPDLLPSDITGVSIYNRETSQFEFRPGPVFANIVVGDEINRASPKTQSALLECMEEHQATVDTTTYHLDRPFMVIATQNPVEMEGTYALPEAQRDRFSARVSIGYPDQQAELAMIDEHAGHDPLGDLQPVSDARHVQAMAETVRRVHIAAELRQYAVELITATRNAAEVRLGASPRATLHLVRAARAQAALSGREYVVPDDIHAVVIPVLAHRLVLTTEAQASRQTDVDVVRAVLQRVPVPRGAR